MCVGVSVWLVGVVSVWQAEARLVSGYLPQRGFDTKMDLLTISYSATVSDATTHSLEIGLLVGMAKWAKEH